MNKLEFMHVLSTHLNRLPNETKKDILYDYEEHFSIGLEQGKTEEEIVRSLGDPRQIARQFSADVAVKQAVETKSFSSFVRAMFAIAGLGFVNLVITLPIFFTLLAVLIIFFAVAFTFVAIGISCVLAAIAAPALPDLIDLGGFNPGVFLFSGVGFIALSLLSFIGCVYLTKYFFKGTLRYLNMNMRIIKQ